MLGHVLLAVGALVALCHTKAVVTNNCQKDVYVWSVPEQPDLATNLALEPGKRYGEPWRAGTAVSPGIAIKISSEPNGIYAAKPEINFQYSVDAHNSSKIWVSLRKVRGNSFDSALLHTCDGVIKDLSGLTKLCVDADEIELVLCGSERTVPSHDLTAAHVISDCIRHSAKRDNTLRSPKVCSGRVITPKRNVPTLPLKTVMRHEAAKHAAGSPAYGAVPLRSLLPDDVSMQGDEIYSRVAKQHDHVTMCTNPFYIWFTEFWGPYSTVKAVLNNEYEALFSDRSWTSDDEVCERSRNTIYPVIPGGRRCYIPFCEEGNVLAGDCGDVAEELELLSRFAGREIEWTDDEDVCENEFAARANRHLLLEPFSQTYSAPEKRFAPTQPAADNTLTAHHLNDVRNVCITTANEKLGKYFGAGVTERLVHRVFPNTRWVEKLDDCSPQAITESRAYHHKLIDKKRKKVKKCIHQLYDPEDAEEDAEESYNFLPILPCEGKACKRLKKDLNNLSKDIGENWAWTDDEETCQGHRISFSEDPTICEAFLGTKTVNKLYGYWGEKYNDILQDIYPDILASGLDSECSDDDMPYARLWLHAHRVEGKRTRRCVSPYCHPFGADCSDVEDDLENLSKKFGRNTDWTTDDDACPEGTVYTLKQLAVDERAAGEADGTDESEEDECIEVLCKLAGIPESVCGTQVELYLRELEMNLGVKIAFSDFPGCDPIVTNATLIERLSDHELCRNDFCRRSDHINRDCKRIEQDFQNFLSKAVHMPAARFSDSSNACASSASRGSSGKHPQVSARPSPRPRTHKKNEKRDILDMELFVCLKSVCPAIKGADRLDAVECLKALQAAEDFSALLFNKRLTFQNDPTVCQSKKDHLKICNKGLCHFDHYSCEEGKVLYRNYIEWLFGLNAKFSDSDDVCGPVLARETVNQTIQTNSASPGYCSKSYCAPHIPGVDCATLERDLSRIMPVRSENERACQDEFLLHRVPAFSQQGKRLLCVKYICLRLDDDVDCTLAFPQIQRYYKEIHKVDIEPTLSLEVCDVPSNAGLEQHGRL